MNPENSQNQRREFLAAIQEGIYRAYDIKPEEDADPAARLARMERETGLIKAELEKTVGPEQAQAYSSRIMDIAKEIDEVIRQVRSFPKVQEEYEYDGFHFSSRQKTPDGTPQSSISQYDGLRFLRSVNVKHVLADTFRAKTISSAEGQISLTPAEQAENAVAKLSQELGSARSLLNKAIVRKGDISPSLADYDHIRPLSESVTSEETEDLQRARERSAAEIAKKQEEDLRGLGEPGDPEKESE